MLARRWPGVGSCWFAFGSFLFILASCWLTLAAFGLFLVWFWFAFRLFLYVWARLWLVFGRFCMRLARFEGGDGQGVAGHLTIW